MAIVPVIISGGEMAVDVTSVGGASPTGTGYAHVTGGTLDPAAVTSIPQADVTNLVSDLALKAPLANPSFTGSVTTPVLNATTGVYCRPGEGGAAGNIFNINWTGAQADLWIDTTNIGAIAKSGLPTAFIETGTFTPVLGGDTPPYETGQVYAPGFQEGNYIKIGPLVHCGIYMQFTDCGTIFGNLVVKNLPYAGGGGSPTHAATIGYMSNLNNSGTMNPRRSVHGYLLAASTSIALFSGDDLNVVNMTHMTGADVNIHTQLVISITYNTTYG